MTVHVLTVVGARPQFVKAAMVSLAISDGAPGAVPIHETLVHTGQHYDPQMSSVFFTGLGIPEPAHHLGVGSGTHAVQTGAMLVALENVMMQEQPDLVLVYGDTNSTLAAALAAAKLVVPVAHVEAGLRSWRREMPEEVNRVITDHLSSLLLCPSERARSNLLRAGITTGVHVVGDVMYDALLWQLARLPDRPRLLDDLSVRSREFVLVTIHRAGNVDDSDRLMRLLEAVRAIAAEGLDVVFPVHPRTRLALGGQLDVSGVRVVEPCSYKEMVALERSARVILTDSGGVQKEAYWLGVPCVTLREETEWTETVDEGWNTLAGSDPDSATKAALAATPPQAPRKAYGTEGAAARVVETIATWMAHHG